MDVVRFPFVCLRAATVSVTTASVRRVTSTVRDMGTEEAMVSKRGSWDSQMIMIF